MNWAVLFSYLKMNSTIYLKFFMGVFLKNSVYVSQCPLEPNYTNPKVRRRTFWTLYKGTIKIPILVPKRGGGRSSWVQFCVTSFMNDPLPCRRSTLWPLERRQPSDLSCSPDQLPKSWSPGFHKLKIRHQEIRPRSKCCQSPQPSQSDRTVGSIWALLKDVTK